MHPTNNNIKQDLCLDTVPGHDWCQIDDLGNTTWHICRSCGQIKEVKIAENGIRLEYPFNDYLSTLSAR